MKFEGNPKYEESKEEKAVHERPVAAKLPVRKCASSKKRSIQQIHIYEQNFFHFIRETSQHRTQFTVKKFSILIDSLPKKTDPRQEA